MALCPDKTIDSNVTGLRIAEERCLGELYPNPRWDALEPNSYSDFGSTITTVARNPINPSRQRRKGVVTDLEAGGGFTQDVTFDNSNRLLQGFLFANARERATTKSMVLGNLAISDVDAGAKTITFSNRRANSAVVAAGGTGYSVGDLLTVDGSADITGVFYVLTVNPATGAVLTVGVDRPGVWATTPANPVATTTGGSGAGATLTVAYGDINTFVAGDITLNAGFVNDANNGIKTVASYATGVVTTVEALTDETPGATATVETIGHKFATADLSVVMNGLLPRITNAAAIDFTDFGFIPGEWVYIDGFSGNSGFARIGAIDAEYIELDKTDWTPVAEAAAGKTVTMYFGTIIRNESNPALIARRSYQLERTLGEDAVGTMSEYLIGAVASELTLNIAQADKVTADFTFVGTDAQHRDGTEGLKGGDRPSLDLSDAFNTSSDFSRIKMSIAYPTNPNPVALFAFVTDLSVTINNNVTPNKAVGRLGAIEMNSGTFEVGGSLTAYFADIAAVKAVRANADITLDFIIVKSNTAMIWDIPLLSLGNGRLAVEQDTAITLPLDTSAAESKFGNTLLVQVFPYVPNSAVG